MHKPIHTVSTYGIAVLSVLLALGAGLLLWDWLEWSGATFFLAAVFATAAYGGTKPGLLALALSVLAIDYYFMTPFHQLKLGLSEMAWLAAFAFAGGGLIYLLDRLRRSRTDLREQAESFRTTLSSIGDAVLTTDTQGRVTFMNEVAEEFSGWTLEEARQRPIDAVLRLINESTREPAANPIALVLEEGRRLDLANDTCLIARDGTVRPIEDSAAPIRDDTGAIVGAVMVFHDVTERRRAERAARESEEKLRFALEAARMGIWEWDIATGDLRWSDNLERQHGFEPGGFGRSFEAFQEIIHPDDREGVARAVARTLEESVPYDEEFRIVWPDGTVRWMAGKGHVVRNGAGKPERLIGVGLDVTERRRAEEALRESEARFRYLADAAPVLIWQADRSGLCTWVNQQWLEFTGRALQEELGNGWLEDIHPEDRERARQTYTAALDRREPFRMEYRLRRHDATYRWVFDHGTPTFDSEGRFEGFIGSCIEIHDRVEAEERVRKLNETLEDRVAERTSAAEERAADLARSERALRDQSRVLESILYSMGEGVVVVDASGRILAWNPEAERLLGPAPANARFTQWPDAYERIGGPDEPPNGDGPDDALAATLRGEQVDREVRLRRKADGREMWIHVTGRPLMHEWGEHGGSVVVMRDVTARKDSEAALRRESGFVELLQAAAVAANEATRIEEALQRTLDAVCVHTGWPLGHAFLVTEEGDLRSSGVWWPETDDRWRPFKEATAGLRMKAGFGFPGHVCTSMQPEWLMEASEHPEFRRRPFAEAAGLRSGFAFPVVVDNSVGAVLEFFSPETVPPDAGLLDVMAHVGTQIGRVIERKRAEEEQARLLAQTEAAEARFRKLLESAPDSVVIADADGSIVLVNDQTEQIFGYTRAELVGKNVETLVPERLRIEHSAQRAQYGMEPQVRPMGLGRDLFGRRADGTEFPVEISLSPLETPEGPLVMSIVRDITERKRLEDALRQSERLAAIGQMITGLSHESRNALQRSLACLELLARKVDDNPQTRRLLEEAQRAQHDLQQVYEEVRQYAAPVNLQRSLQPLDRVWRETWEKLATEREGRQAVLRERVNGTDVRCEIDAFRLEQVFRNLMENSLAACPDQAEIEIECTDGMLAGRPALRVTVRDNGPGLDPEHEKRVFEPFFTTKAKGTGLGMAIVKRIIESHGGRIWLGSAPERGLEVNILLPRSST
jgi:PAS domain S-box-containing protein